MIITATELKTNIGKYLSLADGEDVLITRNGRNVAKLVSVREVKTSVLRPLRGILIDTDITRESIRDERLAKYNEGIY